MPISSVKLPGLRLSESCFIVFPGPFKSSSESPQRTVPNIPRNVPSYQYQSSPLKAVPCRAGGLDGQAEQGVEIVIFIPNSFLG